MVMDTSRTIVFREFSSIGEANVVKSLLEANDIPCFLSNENNVFPGSILTNSLMGIRLHILEKDLETAETLLKEASADQ
jgi:hypothetical protein